MSQQTRREWLGITAGVSLPVIAGCMENGESSDDDFEESESESATEAESSAETNNQEESEENDEETDRDDISLQDQELAEHADQIFEEARWMDQEYPDQRDQYESLLFHANNNKSNLTNKLENEEMEAISEPDLRGAIESRESVKEFVFEEENIYDHYRHSESDSTTARDDLEEIENQVDDLLRFKELNEEEEFFDVFDSFIDNISLSMTDFDFDSPPLARRTTSSGFVSYDKYDDAILGNLVVGEREAGTGETRTHGYEFISEAYQLQYFEFYEEGEKVDTVHLRDSAGTTGWGAQFDKYDPIKKVLNTDSSVRLSMAIGAIDLDDGTPLRISSDHLLVFHPSIDKSEKVFENLIDTVEGDPETDSIEIDHVGASTPIRWTYNESQIYAYARQFGEYIAIFGADSTLWDNKSDRESWFYGIDDDWKDECVGSC